MNQTRICSKRTALGGVSLALLFGVDHNGVPVGGSMGTANKQTMLIWSDSGGHRPLLYTA